MTSQPVTKVHCSPVFVVAEPPELSDEQLAKLRSRMAAKLDRLLWSILCGPVPAPTTLNAKPPCNCRGVIHTCGRQFT